MSILSFKHSPRLGPVAPICVFPAEFDHKKNKFLPETHCFQGLFDSGAFSTCISPNVVAKLNLNPVEKRKAHGITGAKEVSFYTFRIGFIMGREAISSGIKTMTEGPQALLSWTRIRKPWQRFRCFDWQGRLMPRAFLHVI